MVAIHDGARPLAGVEPVRRRRRRPRGSTAGPAGHATWPACCRGPAGELVGVQTPQAFAARTLLAAYERADADGFEGTDTASCVERYAPDVTIAAVAGSARNLKVTYPEDVALADRLGQRG